MTKPTRRARTSSPQAIRIIALAAVVTMLAGVIALVTRDDATATLATTAPTTIASSLPDTVPPETTPRLAPGPAPADSPSTTATAIPPETTTSTTAAPTTTTAPPPTAPPTTVPPPDPGTWAAMAPAPLDPRMGGVRVWTGEEMLVWGGTPNWSDGCTRSDDDETMCGSAAMFDGMAYRPSTDTWRVMADGPVPNGGRETRTVPEGVWLGDELVIWGGWGEPVAAAYDPATDTWRDLPVGPLRRTGHELLAVGTELWVVGGRDGNRRYDAGGAFLDLADEAAGWQPLPLLPNAVTLESTVVDGEAFVLTLANDTDAHTVSARRPGEATWRTVLTWTPAERGWIRLHHDSVMECGSEQIRVIGFDGGVRSTFDLEPDWSCSRLRLWGESWWALLSRFDPDTGRSDVRWVEPDGAALVDLADVPTPLGSHVWTGAEIVAYGACDCGMLGGHAVEGSGRHRPA